jgi:hypothetical protein
MGKYRFLLYMIVAALVVAGFRFALPGFSAKFASLLFGVERVYQAPEIVTVYDTVEVLDTIEVNRWRKLALSQSDTVNLLRRVIRERRPTRIDTIPQAIFRDTGSVVIDTVWAFHPLVGMDALYAPQEWGDSLILRGFSAYQEESNVMLDRWRAVYFNAGCVRSIVVDSVAPSVAFWPMQDPPCGLWCSAKKYGLGALGGFGICAAVK